MTGKGEKLASRGRAGILLLGWIGTLGRCVGGRVWGAYDVLRLDW